MAEREQKVSKVARVKHMNKNHNACISRRPLDTPRKREGKKRNTPRRPSEPIFSQPPPQRLAEIRPMARTEKAPKQKHSTTEAEHTQNQNTDEHDTKQSKGREERSAKRSAHEIAIHAVPCVFSSKTSHIQQDSEQEITHAPK